MESLYNGNGHGATVVYEIRDPNGDLVAQHVRVDKPGGKDVRWRQPDGQNGLNGTKIHDLPLYGSEEVSGWDEDRLITLVEGEKARDALAAVDLPALGTVTGAGSAPSPEPLEVLRDRRVALWPDADDQGRDHMRRVAENLYGIAAEVRWYDWPEAEEKDDAADHPAVQGGHYKTVDRLLTELEGCPEWQPPKGEAETRTITAADLLALDLPEVSWAVPDIIPEGVTILAGKPKLGKSWLALGLCVAVASGGHALGKKEVEKGESLYLSLEDTSRRLQSRLKKVLNGASAPEGMHVNTEWPRLNEGGAEALDEWLTEHPSCRLVVLDTYSKVKPRAAGRRSAYDEDRDAVAPLDPLVEKHGVSILLVHHVRKMPAEDPMDEITDSVGLTSGVDGALVLKRDRGEGDAYLHVMGREIEEETELALTWDPELASWTLAGDADEYRVSKDRRQVIDHLESADGPQKPQEIADALEKSTGYMRRLLPDMYREDLIENPAYGKYTAKSDPGNSGNSSNSSEEGTSRVTDTDDFGNSSGQVIPGNKHRVTRVTRVTDTVDNSSGDDYGLDEEVVI